MALAPLTLEQFLRLDETKPASELAAICLFEVGLRRYESGNLIALRG